MQMNTSTAEYILTSLGSIYQEFHRKRKHEYYKVQLLSPLSPLNILLSINFPLLSLGCNGFNETDAFYENLTINAFNGLTKCNGFNFNYPHTPHHTIEITHWISHTRHQTLDIIHSTSHNRHHTLYITHLTSHTRHHTIDITQ